MQHLLINLENHYLRFFLKWNLRNSLPVQWLRLSTFTAGAWVQASMKMPQAAQCGQQKKKKKKKSEEKFT